MRKQKDHRITYKEAVRLGEERLSAAGAPDAGYDAFCLFSLASGITRTVYYMDCNRIWSGEEEKERYWRLIKEREKRVPLQYITGVQQFMGLDFHVTPVVMIPRQDTETLVEYALERLSPGDKALDVCTGSGCVGISLARLGSVDVQCTDISGEALAVARENGRRLGCGGIMWIQGELLEHVTERNFDMILSNPPYIATEAIDGLMPEVREYEPRLALDGKKDGLYFYRRLAAECGHFLKPGGLICLEIGYDQGKAVKELLAAAGWKQLSVVKDAAGLDRVVSAVWE